MKALSIQIVPAQPGFFTVIADDDERDVVIDLPVIAWRIETYEKIKSDDVFSVCNALTVDGELVSNCIGLQNPDMTISIFQDSIFRSLAELKAHKYPEE